MLAIVGHSQAERIARAFHEAYELIAPECHPSLAHRSRRLWEQVPAPNRELMIRTVEELLDKNVIAPGTRAR